MSRDFVEPQIDKGVPIPIVKSSRGVSKYASLVENLSSDEPSLIQFETYAEAHKRSTGIYKAAKIRGVKITAIISKDGLLKVWRKKV